MGFFRSLYRFIASMFGMAQGSTERATDKMLTASPEAIHSQFAKIIVDSKHDCNIMIDALAGLMVINTTKKEQAKKLSQEIERQTDIENGAISQYLKTKDESYRSKHGDAGVAKASAQDRLKELNSQIEVQDLSISTYKVRIAELKDSIQKLQEEEQETVADIVSSRKLKELNDRAGNISTDVQSQNLQAIRDARIKAKTLAQLTGELNGDDKKAQEKITVVTGQRLRHNAAFDEAIARAAKPFALESSEQKNQISDAVVLEKIYS